MSLTGHKLFRCIALSAVVAGLTTGLSITALHLSFTQPLIRSAEMYERGVGDAAITGHLHNQLPGTSTRSEHGWREAIFTGSAIVLTAIGYALLLGACLSLMSEANWQRGCALGLAGFLIFHVAPTIGLPPSLPGVPAADLHVRQLWWLGTVICTGLGIGVLCLVYAGRAPSWVIMGGALILAPHLIVTPQVSAGARIVPVELAERFEILVLFLGGLFWLVLGIVQGFIFKKLTQHGSS